MKAFVHAYRLINLMSLDIVFGAVVCALFFGRVFSVQLTFFAVTALGLSVWLIYMADHLIDSKLVNGRAATVRHRFHQDHFRKILILFVVVGALDCIVLYFLRSGVFRLGLMLGCCVLVYLLIHRYLKFLKEFSGAMLYTIGILIPALSAGSAVSSMGQIILLFQFFLTAFTNLLIFSWFDREADLRDRHASFAIFFGEQTTKFFLLMLFILQMTLIILQIVVFDFGSAVYVVLAMNFVLMLIMMSSDFFSKDDRYRLVGDVIFLFPLLYLIR